MTLLDRLIPTLFIVAVALAMTCMLAMRAELQQLFDLLLYVTMDVGFLMFVLILISFWLPDNKKGRA